MSWNRDRLRPIPTRAPAPVAAGLRRRRCDLCYQPPRSIAGSPARRGRRRTGSHDVKTQIALTVA
jgi:hypothetical protein